MMTNRRFSSSFGCGEFLMNGEETADKYEDHFVVDVNDVFPNTENNRSKLSSN